MAFFDSISSITSSYSNVPNLGNGCNPKPPAAVIREMPTDTVRLSHNKIVLQEIEELQKTSGGKALYKKLSKQVTKGRKNMDKTKTAKAIMRALEENPETAELAKTIKAKCEVSYVSPAMRKQAVIKARETAKAEQLARERAISAQANAKWQAKRALKNSPEGQILKAIDQEVMHENQQINRMVNNPEELQRNAQELKQQIRKIAEDAKTEVRRIAAENADDATKQSGKGLWNWLTKTTKGKWTMAGVALVAVAAGAWAYLAHKNKSADALNEVA